MRHFPNANNTKVEEAELMEKRNGRTMMIKASVLSSGSLTISLHGLRVVDRRDNRPSATALADHVSFALPFSNVLRLLCISLPLRDAGWF